MAQPKRKRQSQNIEKREEREKKHSQKKRTQQKWKKMTVKNVSRSLGARGFESVRGRQWRGRRRCRDVMRRLAS